MANEITTPPGTPLTTAERSNAVAESLRQLARVSRYADRKKGIRSYQTHVQRDHWILVLFGLCFVLPVLLTAGYLYLVASDRYVTEARFALRPSVATTDKAAGDQVGTGSGVPKQMIVQDSVIAMNYIASRQMIETLEREMPIREMFSRDSIDWLSRFNPEKPIEKFVTYWDGRVKTTIDSTSAIITLTVTAFDAKESYDLARAVLTESERMVNDLSRTARNDAVVESQRELAHAEARMAKTRFAMRDLRNREGVLDATVTNTNNLTVIAGLRKARIDLAVQMSLAQRDLAPDSRRIQDLKIQIRDLDENIDKIERQLASSDPNRRRVLADAMTQFEAYDTEQQDAATYYSKVLAANEKARIVASRQIEFFTSVVDPVLASSAVEPRRALILSLVALGALVVFGLATLMRKYVFA